jgi:hypothetical protein
LTSFLFLPLFKTLVANIIDLISGVKNVVATLKIEIFIEDAAKRYKISIKNLSVIVILL